MLCSTFNDKLESVLVKVVYFLPNMFRYNCIAFFNNKCEKECLFLCYIVCNIVPFVSDLT